MEYGSIEGLDRPVSRLILGTMAYRPEPEERYAHWAGMLDAFLAAGGNMVDTAHTYGGGRSEQTLGRWLQERANRRQVLILGKGAHPQPGKPHRVTPEDIDSDISESLQRLQTPYIDLYLLHRDDPAVPVGPIVECLNRQIDAGRLRAIGGSNWTSQRIDAANEYAAAHQLRGFTASSPNLSLAVASEPIWPDCVTVDTQELAWYRQRQFPLLSWSSQARGFFSGRFSPQQREIDPDVTRALYSDDNWERLRRARELAEKKATTPTRVALAWVLRQPLPTFPLIGPLKREELQDSLAALEVALSPEEAQWLFLEREALPA
ncbi:MAG TPA: aldo/keto reductase [Chloroflexota bacterium]|jgi:aryl-alcohol dehydrogenase-like predicted oxidoreductase|nr:aldo/keto reductase [Chloroflexota bacterium]